MSETRLTIGGFTQPGVARSLIDMPANTEKGLSHRFLWIFPRPVYGKFTSLEAVDKKFADDLGKFPHNYEHIAFICSRATRYTLIHTH